MVMRLRGRDLHVSALAVPRIDPLPLPELPDPNRSLFGRPSHLQPTFVPPPLPHVRQRKPHHVAEPPIPPTGPEPAPISLEQNHRRLRLQLLHMPSSPHPRVATANHNDIGLSVPHKLGR